MCYRKNCHSWENSRKAVCRSWSKKSSQRRWCPRGKIQWSRLPRLTLERSEPLRDHNLDSLFFLENPDFCEILYYIRFVNGALLGMEWHAAVRTMFYRTPKGFSFLYRILKRKSILLVNRLFKNIDVRSQFNRSKYWATSVIGETMKRISRQYHNKILHKLEYLFFIHLKFSSVKYKQNIKIQLKENKNILEIL